jgi:hypothetical protein
LLPHELLALRHPVLRRDFARRFLDAELLQYTLRAVEEKGRGPMIVCIDGSSSMAGDKEIWSKAVSLTLLDIAQRVNAEQAVPLSMGYLNAIWQRDASAMSLQSLAVAAMPPNIINIAGPEMLSVRQVAQDFGTRLKKAVCFEGVESGDALLSNAEKSYRLFGRPSVGADQVIAWIADWVRRGGTTLAKPTHFEERAGRF